MESVTILRDLFAKAEETLDQQGRDAAKVLLPEIYDMLMSLNKWDKANSAPMTWNPQGELTEQEFNELNLGRNKLSNAIGIMTANNTVRHDLNKI